jgi:cytochrome c oxidase subunit 3
MSPTITRKESEIGRGGEIQPPALGGNNGGGRGGDGFPDYGARLRRARLGLAVASIAITMLFVGFSSAYVFRQGLPTLDSSGTTYVRDWIPLNLPVVALLINTLLLVLSSITAELARRQMARRVALAPVESIPGVSLGRERNIPWLGITVALALGFLTGQLLVWRELAGRGFYMATNPSSSFFYVLTAAHAVHLTGGVLAMLFAASSSLLARPLEARRIVVDITAWYWHLMAVLWIYIFALLWFMR